GAGGARTPAAALVRDVAHTNVAMMFGEDERIVPADDTLSVVRGPFGSYPKFFFEVKAEEVEAFVDALRAVATDADFEGFVTRYGVRRTDSRFWAFSDWLHQDGRREEAARGGPHDRDRYTDP